MRHLRCFSIALLLTVAAVTISYLWLDRPISYFAHEQTAQYAVFREMQRAPEYMAIIACLVFVIAGCFILVRRPMTRPMYALLVSGTSLAVASLIKEQLKFVFGRTWPETWVNNNPSLIRDGVSGFNFFHGGAGYGSFPSGHTAATCAALSVLWIAYPRYRLLYAAIITIVVIGLLGANYHFVSDTVAGGFVGWVTGWLAVLFWDEGGRPWLAPNAARLQAGAQT
jgi:membrane-associated phospholipid phosphatase